MTNYFKLKDFNNTFNKYATYKPERFNEMLKNDLMMDILSDYQKNCFYSGAENYLYNNRWALNLIHKENKTKRDLRALATCINGAMREYLLEVVGEYSKNDNEKNSFAVKLYLYHYDFINEVMQELLDTFISE